MKGKCLLILFLFLGPPILEKLKLDIVSAMPQGEGKSKSLKGQQKYRLMRVLLTAYALLC